MLEKLDEDLIRINNPKLTDKTHLRESFYFHKDFIDFNRVIDSCVKARAATIAELQYNLAGSQDNAAYVRLYEQIEALKIWDAQLYILTRDPLLWANGRKDPENAATELNTNYYHSRRWGLVRAPNRDYFITRFISYAYTPLSIELLNNLFVRKNTGEQKAIVRSWGQAGDNAANTFIAEATGIIAARHYPSLKDMPLAIDVLNQHLKEIIEPTPHNLSYILDKRCIAVILEQFDAGKFNTYLLPDSIKNLRKQVLAKIGAELEAADSMDALAKLDGELASLKTSEARLIELSSKPPVAYFIVADEKNSSEDLKKAIDELEALHRSFDTRQRATQTLCEQRLSFHLPTHLPLRETLESIKVKRSHALEAIRVRILGARLTNFPEIESELAELKAFDEALTLAAPKLQYEMELDAGVHLNKELIAHLVAHDQRCKELKTRLEVLAAKEVDSLSYVLLTAREHKYYDYGVEYVMPLKVKHDYARDWNILLNRHRSDRIKQCLAELETAHDKASLIKIDSGVTELEGLDREMLAITQYETERWSHDEKLRVVFDAVVYSYKTYKFGTVITAEQRNERSAFTQYHAEYSALLTELNALKAFCIKVPKKEARVLESRTVAITKLLKDVHDSTDAERYALIRTQITALKRLDAELQSALRTDLKKVTTGLSAESVDDALERIKSEYDNLSKDLVVTLSTTTGSLSLADLAPRSDGSLTRGRGLFSLNSGAGTSAARAGAGAEEAEEVEAAAGAGVKLSRSHRA